MIYGKEIDIAINNVFGYLDTIDLLPYINIFNNSVVWKLMDALSEKYPYKDKYSVTLFDAVTEDEFADYLRDRYKITIREKTETQTYFYINVN